VHEHLTWSLLLLLLLLHLHWGLFGNTDTVQQIAKFHHPLLQDRHMKNALHTC